MSDFGMIGVRRANLEDVLLIDKFINNNPTLLLNLEIKYGKYNIATLIDISILSVVAYDINNEIIGFACFNDIPPYIENADLYNWQKWFKDIHNDYAHLSRNNLMWLTFFIALPNSELFISENLFRSVFSTLAWVNSIGVLLPPTIQPYIPLPDLFEHVPIKNKFDMKSNIYICPRSVFVSTLQIRKAKVEDHDDLIPIFEQQSSVLKLIYGEFFLAELIQSQNSENITLVAEANHQAVGLMSLTVDIDVGILQKCFDLEPYDNLYKEPTGKEVNAFCVSLFCVDSAYESRSIEFLESAFNMFPNIDYCILTLPPTVQHSQLIDYFTPATARPNNTFSHVLYLCHKDSLKLVIEARFATLNDEAEILSFTSSLENSADLRTQIFSSLRKNYSDSSAKELEYYDDKVLELVNHDSSTHVENLQSLSTESKLKTYPIVFHIDGQVVGVAIVSKTVNLEYLRGHFILEDYISSFPKESSTSAFIKYFIINPLFSRHSRYLLKELLWAISADNLLYQVFPNDLIQPLTDEMVQVKPRHALSWNYERVVAFNKDPTISQSDAINDLKGEILLKDENLFSLHVITKRLISQTKQTVNVRLVIIGGSETTYSLLESLFMVPFLNFCSVIVIARNELLTHSIAEETQNFLPESAYYNSDMLKKLSLLNKIKFIKGSLSDIDREKKLVYVADGSFVPYDYLILAPGLQPQSLSLFDENGVQIAGAGAYQYIPPHDSNKIDQISSVGSFNVSTGSLLTKKNQASLFQSFMQTIANIEGEIADSVDYDQTLDIPGIITLNSNESINSFFNILNNIPIAAAGPHVVYGSSIEAFTCIRGLLLQGATGSSIAWVSQDSPSVSNISVQVLEKIYMNLDSYGVSRVHGMEILHVELKEGFPTSVILRKISQDPNDPLDCPLPQNLQQLEDNYYRLPTGAFFNASKSNIDSSLFRIIDKSSLVFDGRLVVDSAFRTSDPSIFAAGPAAKFSKSYGVDLNMDQYSSKESGELLAHSIRDCINSCFMLSPFQAPSEPPKFTSPKIICGVLPGDVYFLQCNSSSSNNLAKEIIIDHERGLAGFTFDVYTRLDNLFYLGPNRLSPIAFSYLIGKSYSYMNCFVEKFEEGTLDDILYHFEGGWSSPLFHDGFTQVCNSIKTSFIESPEIDGIIQELFNQLSNSTQESGFQMTDFIRSKLSTLEPETRSKITAPLLTFLYQNSMNLPGFSFPEKMF